MKFFQFLRVIKWINFCRNPSHPFPIVNSFPSDRIHVSKFISKSHCFTSHNYVRIIDRSVLARVSLKMHLVYTRRACTSARVNFTFVAPSSFTLSVDRRRHRHLSWLVHCRNDCDGTAGTVAATCNASRRNTARRRRLWGRSVLADRRLRSYLNQMIETLVAMMVLP